MIFALLLVVVVLAIAGAVGGGRLVFGDPDRPPRESTGLGMSPLVAVVGGVLILFLVVLPLVGFGLRGSSGGEDGGSVEPSLSAPASTSTTVLVKPPEAELTAGTSPVRSDVLGPVVHVDERTRAVGRLRSDTVLQVRVDGFDPFASAVVQQCVSGSCANALRVQFGEDGVARFQYLVTDDFLRAAASGGRCRLDAAPCSIVVVSYDGERLAEVVTVFGDDLPPPGELRADRTRDLLDGDEIELTLSGLRAGTDVELVLCAAPDAAGSARCGAPGPVVPVTIGRDGSATASMVVGETAVGEERVTCGRGANCVVAIRSGSAFVRALPVRLHFAAPPGADYDGTRLLIGLGIGAALLVLALVLIRRTDWSSVGEEAAPEIDDAEYADLDAIVAALPPEEDENLEPASR